MSDDARALLQLLRSDDASERIMALEGLVREHPDQAPPHVREALGDPEPSVRAAALRAARSVDAALDSADLREVLEDAHEEVRIRAALALPGLDPEHALDLLALRLDEETSPKVLASLVRVVSETGGPEHYGMLAPFLHHDDNRVRANAVEALDALLRRCLLTPLHAMDHDGSNRVRANVVVVLARFDVEAAAGVLEPMVGHEDKWFRLSAAWAAGATGIPRLLEAIVPLLRDLEPDVQLQAIKSLAGLPRVGAVLTELERLAGEEADPSVAHYARRTLEGLQG